MNTTNPNKTRQILCNIYHIQEPFSFYQTDNMVNKNNVLLYDTTRLKILVFEYYDVNH